MSLADRIGGLLRPRKPHSQPDSRKVVLTRSCLDGLTSLLSITAAKDHEGMVYLVGLVNARTTLAITAHAPRARTTTGSVDVAALDMAALVRMSSRAGLQIVGQVHTHPKTAFHSTGDLAGMRLRHPGYVSIVLPEYGKLLPRLDGAHTLLWDGSRFAAPLSATAIFAESCDGRT